MKKRGSEATERKNNPGMIWSPLIEMKKMCSLIWIKVHESMVHFLLKLVLVGMHFKPNKR